MIVQEPIQAAVWHCLNNYAYADATFLAERLLSEVNTEDTLLLLATAYYRSGKPGRAYTVIRNYGHVTPQLKYLLARCCYELGRFDEAERVLMDGSILRSKHNLQEIQNEYGSVACFVMQLLGLICLRTERMTRSSDALRGSMKLNPLLWHSFALLCDNGDKPDPLKVFKLDGLENFSNIHGNTISSMLNNTESSNVGTDSVITNISTVSAKTSVNEVITHSTQQPVVGQNLGILPQLTQLITPNSISNIAPLITANNPVQQSVISTPLPYSMASLNTPISANLSAIPDSNDTSEAVTKVKKVVRFNRISPITPHFGVLPLNLCCNSGDSDSSWMSSFALLSPSPLSLSQLDSQSNKMQQLNVGKRILCRSSKDTPLVVNKPAVFAPTGNNSNFQSPPTGPGYVRRSSRLFGNSSSVKENNKNRFVAPKSPARKAKTRSTKSQSSLSELNEKNRSENDILSSEKTLSEKNVANQTLNQQALTIQKQSVEGLMSLLRDTGAAYLELAQYNCKKALELFSQLPSQHYHSTWVQSHIAKAHFEMNDYTEAIKYFAQVREKDSNHLPLMEYYSTALWHLQKEVQLSALAQDLLEIDKDSPEAWCAAGNCFSLQKEHEAAIKFFNRAIQVDPYFSYSYSLLGHEHLATEELEKALNCYRSAIRLDKRHYNSWYGIGLVYFKQERFPQSEWYFRKAVYIHPECSVLLCHIAVAQHTQQKSNAALSTLNRALAIDPQNPLCKYHRASILLALDRHQDALEELLQLKKLVPRESNVYFLLGKVYKRLGDTHLALMNFSWAIDLDPKGANNQFKETIDPAVNCCPIDEDDNANNNPQENAPSEMNSSLIAAESSQESLILETSTDNAQISGIEEHPLSSSLATSISSNMNVPSSSAFQGTELYQSASARDTIAGASIRSGGGSFLGTGASGSGLLTLNASGVLTPGTSSSINMSPGRSSVLPVSLGTSSPAISVLSSSPAMHLTNSSLNTPSAYHMPPTRSLRMVSLTRQQQQFSFGFNNSSFDDSLQTSPGHDNQDSPNEEVL